MLFCFLKKWDRLVIAYTLILFTFDCHHLSAQSIYPTNDKQITFILQKNDTKACPLDEEFSHQIKNGKILFDSLWVFKNDLHALGFQVGNWKFNGRSDFTERIHFYRDSDEEIQNDRLTQSRLILHAKDAQIYSSGKFSNEQNKSKKISFKKSLGSKSRKDAWASDIQVGNRMYEKNGHFSKKDDREILNSKRDHLGLISLTSGVVIYSEDKDFNQQIENKKIVFNSALISEVNISDIKYLIIASKKKSPEKFQTLEIQTRNNKENEKSDLLRKVQKDISEYEKKKEDFMADRLESCPSSDHFSSAQKRNAECLNYRPDPKDNTKIFFLENFFSVRKALYYLYTYNITHYNNKSLDFCFSEIFSVRPPPVWV